MDTAGYALRASMVAQIIGARVVVAPLRITTCTRTSLARRSASFALQITALACQQRVRRTLFMGTLGVPRNASGELGWILNGGVAMFPTVAAPYPPP